MQGVARSERAGVAGELAQIGKAIRIKGELHGEEDLVIEGQVEGTIELKNYLENHPRPDEAMALMHRYADIAEVLVSTSILQPVVLEPLAILMGGGPIRGGRITHRHRRR